MKRYAIVRVECPPKNEIDAQFVCFPEDNNCSGCRYGDTKEQMIRKVAQIIKRETGNDGIFISDGRNIQDSKSVIWEEVAKEIVEFLGVEDDRKI